MATRQRKRSFLRHLVIPAMSILVVSYFGYHAVTGDLGMRAREQIEADIARLTAERNGVIAERMALEKRVALLRAQAIDPDLLDERARAQLNMVNPDDIVIFRSSLHKPLAATAGL